MTRTRALLTVAIFGGLAVAGCLDGTPAQSSTPGPGEPSITFNGVTVGAGAPIEWAGIELSPPESQEFPLQVEIPSGFWDTNEGALEIFLGLHEEEESSLLLELRSQEGATLVEGTGWFGAVAVRPEIESGNYSVFVGGDSGRASYSGRIQLSTRPVEDGAPRDLLPNLVTLIPTDLGFPYMHPCVYTPAVNPPSPLPPSYTYADVCAPWVCAVSMCAPSIAVGALGIRGCDIGEYAEDHARRCLRFSNRIGNAGEGPFDIRLATNADLTGLAGRGEWVQTILRSDGSVREELVGVAAYHPSHDHYHYEGMAQYQLFRFDAASGERGEAVKAGRKVGFCFVDMGLVEFGRPFTPMPRYGWNDDAGCGLMPNWFDEYWSTLMEQYIEITDLEDGVYELVSRANAVGTAIESDLTDNESSVVFSLKGNTVEVHRSG